MCYSNSKPIGALNCRAGINIDIKRGPPLWPDWVSLAKRVQWGTVGALGGWVARCFGANEQLTRFTWQSGVLVSNGMVGVGDHGTLCERDGQRSPTGGLGVCTCNLEHPSQITQTHPARDRLGVTRLCALELGMACIR